MENSKKTQKTRMENDGFFHSEETRKKISDSNKGKTRPKTKCKYCSREISKSTIKSHENVCKMNPNQTKTLFMPKYLCKYCGKEIGGKHNLKRHEIACKRKING